jgi:hypothetical protein
MSDSTDDSKLSRRLLVLRVGTLAGAGAAVSACVAPGPGYYAPAAPVVVAPPPRGTGITDADPSDGPGFGRGGYRGNRVRTGLTDADPSDGPGFGRGGYSGNRVRTGLTDADPSDGPGFGRGGYRGNRVRTGITDADPSDGPGFGRGGRRW